MKRLISIVLSAAILLCCSPIVLAKEPEIKKMEVKPYGAYNPSGIVISTTDASKSVQTVAKESTSSGIWCNSSVAFTSVSGIENTTFDYVDAYTDSTLDIEMYPGTDVFMIYVETPNFLGDTAAISLLDVKLKQDGMEESVSTEKSFYSYMDVRDGVWNKAGTVTGELNSIGRNFKGYIKIDVNELGGIEQLTSIDITDDYSVSGIKIGYNHVGGEFGSFIVGGYFAVIYDTDTAYMTNEDTDETVCVQALGGDFDFNGKFEEADLETARKISLGEAEISNSAMLRADIRDDGTSLGASDIVHLRKLIDGYDFTTQKIELEPSTAEKDKEITAKNPDRGYRMKIIIDMDEDDPEKLVAQIDEYPRLFKNEADRDNLNAWADPTCVKLYFYLTDWYDKETLPEEALNKIRTSFEHVRELGQTVLLRFCYQKDHKSYDTQQAKDEIMFKHMEQLKPILEEYKDVLNCHELGFLGAFGEWHSYGEGFWDDENKTNGRQDYDKVYARYEFDEIAIIKKAIDITPEGVPVLLRFYILRERFLEVYPEYKNRVGLLNDAYFGYMNFYQGSPYEDMRSEDTIAAYRASLYAPYSGEFMWGAEWFDERNGSPYPRVDAKKAILGFKYFHQNTFSTWHNSWEGTASIAKGAWSQTEREGDMEIWAKTKVDEKWLKTNNIFYSESSFKDANGKNVNRSYYEFVRDYLGYKLEGKDVTIGGKLKKNGVIDVKMNLVNYGFSAAFNMQSEFVILDEENNIVSRVSAGNPVDWSNTSCLEVHTINGQLKLPSKRGNYKLALYVHNRAGTGAYIGNDIEWVGEYNILTEFKI